jgi:O-antigen/teichoic acid export membrane protein
MFVRLYNKALASPLMRNFAKLFAGTAAAKAVGFLAMPIIARLVTPEEFGEFSVFTAVVSVVAPLLGLRYVDAIPIPKSTSRATQLLTLALLLISVNATLLLVTAWLLLDVIAKNYAFIDVRFLLLAYLAVIGLAIYEALNLWAVRVRNYSVIARTQVGQALVGALSKVALSYFAIPMGLMIGQVTQNLTGITSFIRAHRAPYKKYRFRISGRLLKQASSRYTQYPKYRLASQMVLVITQALPVLAVGKIYGQSEAGQLGLAFAVVSAPVSMIVGNVRKLYYGEVAKIGASRIVELRSLTIRLMVKMTAVASIGCIAMYFLSERIFTFVFGAQWQISGQICSLYSLYILSQFVVGPFVDLLNVLDRQKLFLIINIFRFVLVAFLFLVLAPRVELLELIGMYSLGMFLFYLGLMMYFFCLLGRG